MTELSPTARPGVMRQYWSAHQRFFKQLCISIKLPTVVRRAPPPKKNNNNNNKTNPHQLTPARRTARRMPWCFVRAGELSLCFGCGATGKSGRR